MPTRIHSLRHAALMTLAAISLCAGAKTTVINVRPVKGDATESIAKAITKARKLKGTSQTIVRLAPGEYHISRTEATEKLYHVSNTTSVHENPEPVKHIGIYLNDLRDFVLDGQGATLVTHGEMTPWVIDGSSNVTITNLIIKAADPSVPEMTVESVDSFAITARLHPDNDYTIRGNKLFLQGDGWEFTDGIAQIYRPDRGTSLRCPSPVADAISVEEVEPYLIRMTLPYAPQAKPGDVFQLRHSLRTEVAGLINRSTDVKLSNLNLRFMGNFGIVAQTSTNITYNDLVCRTDSASGRTCAGFADFLQVSGCRGNVSITGCTFAGSHDDPINIHGTHLKVTDWGDGRTIRVRYMHPQTFGFQSFFAGDSIEVIDPSTLRPMAWALVKGATQMDNYTLSITLDRTLTSKVTSGEAVVENISWTPSVLIADNYFTLTPTRGILVTTRRPVVIERNWFDRVPMASILVADDARSWFESGYTTDVTIRNNRFTDCSWPAVYVAPENSAYDGPVHRNLTITDNIFEHSTAPAGTTIDVKATEHVRISGNTVKAPRWIPVSVRLAGCTDAQVDCK